MAPCFADTNDLALDPAPTAEDTQRTMRSIPSHTGWALYSLSVSPSVLLLPASYLSFLSVTLPSPLSSYFLISSPLCYQRSHFSLSLLPQTLSISPSLPLIHSPSSLNYSLHPSQSISLCLSFFLSLVHPSFRPSFSLSLSLSLFFYLSLSLLAHPTASLSLGHGEQCQPTWGPVRSQPRRQGAPENTHNSVFQLGCGIKGSLTHGWLCGSALDHLWKRRPATGTRVPHCVCVSVGDRVRVNECVVSPRDPVARAPVPLVPANYSMGNLLYLSVPPCCRSPSPPSSPRPHPNVFVSSGYKTGGSLGPPISPPPWGDMTDE